MQGIRSFFIAASGMAILALAVFFTASLSLAFAGVLAVISLVRLFSARLAPAPIRAEARSGQRDLRIWNDGKGTIIDL